MDNDREVMRRTLEMMVRGIVDHPDDVCATYTESARRIVFELTTHSSDTGQVIGRKGAVISSIRTIVDAWAGLRKIRADIDYLTEVDRGSR